MLFTCLMLVFGSEPPPAKEPPPTPEQVRTILNRIRESAQEETIAQQRLGLELFDEAQALARDGNRASAIRLAKRAAQMLPRNRVILNAIAEWEANDRDLPLRQKMVIECLKRGLEHASVLAGQNRAAEALAFLDVIFAVEPKMPKRLDVANTVEQAEQLARSLREAPPPPEPAAAAPLKLPTEPSQKLLARRCNVAWQARRLDEALAELAQVVEIVINIDPQLVAAGTFQQQAITFVGEDVPARTLLRMITEMTGTEAMLLDRGQVFITTKANALAAVIERKQAAARTAGKPAPLPEKKASESPMPPEPPPAAPEPQVPLPSFLDNPAAFRLHLTTLLKPEPPKEPAPPPANNELPPQ